MSTATAPGQVQSGTGLPANGTQAQTNLFGTNAAGLNGSQAAQGANGQQVNAQGNLLTSGGTIAPPGAAVSAYEYQQYVAAAPLILGPQVASILGLSPTQQVTGQQVIQAFYDLSANQLTQLEQFLYHAGMYANVEGETSTQGIVFGTADVNAFNALSQAILQASNGLKSGETLSGYLANRIVSGAGQAEIQGNLQPITGGNNAYQNVLPSPTDIYATALQIFQQYLGRNPTSQELDQIVSQVQSQTQSYNLAGINQQESTKQAQYQQQVNSRNAVSTPQNVTASGQVPTGPFNDAGQFAVSFLQYLGDPISTSNVAAIISWVNQNGGLNGLGTNNPLGVQTSAPGSTPSGKAQNFSSMSQFMVAASNLLNSPEYQSLAAALQSGTSTTTSAVQAEIKQWSAGKVNNLNVAGQTGAAQQAINQYSPPTAAPTTPDMTRQQAPNFVGPLPSGTSGSPGPYQGGGVMLGPNQRGSVVSPGPTAPKITPGLYPGLPPGSTQAGLQAAAAAQTPSGNVNPQQGLSSPGDNYAPANILTEEQAPSPTSVATQEATTGANTIPYLGQQFLNAYQAILTLIQQPLKP